MSELRFVIHDRTRLPGIGKENGYLAGLDLNPWKATWEISDPGFSLEYEEEDSPKFHQQVILASGELMTLVTSTLKSTEAPHLLWLELARGTVDRLRNRVGAWQVNGLIPSDELNTKVVTCGQVFCSAIAQKGDIGECEKLSVSAIDLALEAMEVAISEYLLWVNEGRTAESAVSKTLRGVWLTQRELDDVDRTAKLNASFNTAAVAVDWSEIQPTQGEWNWAALDEKLDKANQQEWNVVLGPVLRFDRRSIPDWVFSLKDDFAEVRAAVQLFVTTVVKRCASKVDLCVLSTKINFEGDTQWSGSNRLQLIIDAAAGLRRAAENLPFIVGVSQPFSESQTRGNDYPVLHLADGLMRANIDLCGFALDLDFGFDAGETWPRDLCQLVDRLGQWSMFGLPIVVVTSQKTAGQEAAGHSAGLRNFSLWLKLLDRTASVHAVFWPLPEDEQEGRMLLDSDGAPTAAYRWIREGFDLPA